MLPCPGYYKQCCDEHWGTRVFDLWFSPDICPGVGLLAYIVVLFSLFLKHLHTVLHSGLSVYILTNSEGRFLFLHTFSSIYVHRLFNDRHFDCCEVIPHCSFDLHFHFSLSCIGEGNGNPLQYSCLEDPRDGGAWWAAVYGVARSRTRLKRLSIALA